MIAPSRLPKEPGDRVKTDRRDAASLARLYRPGLLTPVHILTESEEAVRDLCPARQDLYDDLKRVRRRLLAFLLRRGIVYRAGWTWTRDHHRFLSTLTLDEAVDRDTFGHYLSVVQVREAELRVIERDVLSWLDQPPLAESAHRLAAYRLGSIAGMTLASEVGEWTRFHRPTGFMSFTGLVPSEYSSGGRRRQGGITKAGNTMVRIQLVESAWHYRWQPRLSGDLRERQGMVGPDTIARKAQQRICGRYRRLTARQLDSRIVVTALARELAGFLGAEMTAPP